MYFRLYKCNYCDYVFAHWYVAEKVVKVANVWTVEYPHKKCELCGLQSNEVLDGSRWDNLVVANSLGFFFSETVD